MDPAPLSPPMHKVLAGGAAGASGAGGAHTRVSSILKSYTIWSLQHVSARPTLLAVLNSPALWV